MRRMIIVQMCIMIMLVGMSMNFGVSDVESIARKSLYEILKPELKGVIRGVNFEMTRRDILAIEKNATIIRENNGLIIRDYINGFSVEDLVEINYKFNEKGLFLITVEATQKDKVSINRLHSTFERHFNDNLKIDGSYEGFKTWIGHDEVLGDEFVVLMRDMTYTSNGKLSLELYAI